MTYKFGNKNFYAELPSDSGFGQPVEIWHNIGLGQCEVMCVASDKFNAMSIIEALIKKDELKYE